MMYDSEIEAAVLGAIMLEGKCYYEVADKLDEDCFAVEANKFIYRCIEEVNVTSKIDILTVSHKAMELKGALKDKFLREDVMWPYEISQLTSKVATTHHINEHIDILHHFRSKRKVYNMCAETMQRIDKGDTSLPEIIQEASDMFIDATTNRKTSEVTMQQGLDDFVEEQSKDLALKLTPTYLPEVDRIIGGFEYSDLIIIAGAASMGKTSFMLRLIQNYLNQDKSVSIFSLEMSNHQLLTRLISMETGIPVRNIRYNNLDNSDWDLINSLIAKYKQKNFIMDGQTSKLNDVLNKIKAFKMKHDVQIVFIDYLQLVVNSKGKMSREQEVAQIARSLKNIAKELNIVVVALSQLSRAVSLRDNKRPMLSDLRESGEIEQAADTIMFAFREEYYNMENPRDIQDAEIIIAKGRNVGTGTAHMKFQPKNVKFISPEADNFNYVQDAEKPLTPIEKIVSPGQEYDADSIF